jgi:succinyl-diaminopimelate desuccinylase
VSGPRKRGLASSLREHRGELGDRLAARALELIDIPSESRHEQRLGAHVMRVLAAEDLGDGCLLVRRGAPVLLAGHLDTVPAQDNLPGRIDGGRVRGLGASDMKGALAVMAELAIAGAPFDCLFFGREELPGKYSALVPLLERERLDYELVVMMEPTANELHAGCLGNVNATWTFHGRSGHSARPWDADNAIHAAARGIVSLADFGREEHRFDGLSFFEVASVTQIAGGIAQNVIPDRVDCHVNYRFAPGRTPDEAEARLRELCPGGELTIDSLAPSGPVAVSNPRAQALIAAGELHVAPKQAWTPVAEFGAAGLDAVNFGPGEPAQAHRRDESVEIAALVRSYKVLEAFAA